MVVNIIRFRKIEVLVEIARIQRDKRVLLCASGSDRELARRYVAADQELGYIVVGTIGGRMAGMSCDLALVSMRGIVWDIPKGLEWIANTLTTRMSSVNSDIFVFTHGVRTTAEALMRYFDYLSVPTEAEARRKLEKLLTKVPSQGGLVRSATSH